MSKTMNTRIQQKHDTEANWVKATGFSPKEGELIIYDADDAHHYQRIKVGDGTTNVNALPFVNEIITLAEIDEICGASIVSGKEASL